MVGAFEPRLVNTRTLNPYLMTRLARGMLLAFGRIMMAGHTTSRHLGHIGMTLVVEGHR